MLMEVFRTVKGWWLITGTTSRPPFAQSRRLPEHIEHSSTEHGSFNRSADFRVPPVFAKQLLRDFVDAFDTVQEQLRKRTTQAVVHSPRLRAEISQVNARLPTWQLHSQL